MGRPCWAERAALSMTGFMAGPAQISSEYSEYGAGLLVWGKFTIDEAGRPVNPELWQAFNALIAR